MFKSLRVIFCQGAQSFCKAISLGSARHNKLPWPYVQRQHTKDGKMEADISSTGTFFLPESPVKFRLGSSDRKNKLSKLSLTDNNFTKIIRKTILYNYQSYTCQENICSFGSDIQARGQRWWWTRQRAVMVCLWSGACEVVKGLQSLTFTFEQIQWEMKWEKRNFIFCFHFHLRKCYSRAVQWLPL